MVDIDRDQEIERERVAVTKNAGRREGPDKEGVVARQPFPTQEDRSGPKVHPSKREQNGWSW